MANSRLRDRKLRVAAIVLALVALVEVLGIPSWPDQLRGMRDATSQDELYRYVAQELAEPSLCRKIPWSDESPGGFFTAPSYERSECYAFIAARTGNPWLCWKVRRLGRVRLLDHQTSGLSCVLDVRRGFNGGVGVSQAELVGFFARLGYDPDTIQAQGLTPPAVNLRDLYRQLPARPGIVSRVEKAFAAQAAPSVPLPDTAPPMANAVNYAYLADLAALVTNDPKWCARIPENLPLAGQPAPFREWCKFTVASNTKNPALCRQIPIPPTERDPRLSLQANCIFQTTSPYSTGRYGPEVPQDDRVRAILGLLGYDVPTAQDLSPEQIYAVDDRFLDELKKKTDPQHIAARQRFMERIKQLP